MEETQSNARVSDDDAPAQADEARAQEAAVVLTARLLANPRRIRRA
jgi:hypothetical protein